MEQDELLAYVAGVLERLKIPYFVTGSFAGLLFGEVRHTNDIDVVLALGREHVTEFCAAFPESEFYIDRDAVMDAIVHRFQFNVIHKISLTKVDFIVPEESHQTDMRFERAIRLQPAAGIKVSYSSPEDLIIKKLEFYRESDSSKHLRDIAGILKRSGDTLDHSYINKWVSQLDLQKQWQEAQELARRPG